MPLVGHLKSMITALKWPFLGVSDRLKSTKARHCLDSSYSALLQVSLFKKQERDSARCASPTIKLCPFPFSIF